MPIDLADPPLPAPVWLAIMADFASALGGIGLAVVLLQSVGNAGRWWSATDLLASAGVAVMVAWLFFRLARGLLDRKRLARSTQIVASVLVAGGGVLLAIRLADGWEALDLTLGSGPVLAAVTIHLVAALSMLSPSATDSFRRGSVTRVSMPGRRERR